MVQTTQAVAQAKAETATQEIAEAVEQEIAEAVEQAIAEAVEQAAEQTPEKAAIQAAVRENRCEGVLPPSHPNSKRKLFLSGKTFGIAAKTKLKGGSCGNKIAKYPRKEDRDPPGVCSMTMKRYTITVVCEPETFVGAENRLNIAIVNLAGLLVYGFAVTYLVINLVSKLNSNVIIQAINFLEIVIALVLYFLKKKALFSSFVLRDIVDLTD